MRENNKVNPLERWVVIFLLLVTVIAWNFLVGCAELPKCEYFKYRVVHDDNGRPYYFLDEENAVALVRLIEGLEKRTCRLEG